MDLEQIKTAQVCDIWLKIMQLDSFDIARLFFSSTPVLALDNEGLEANVRE